MVVQQLARFHEVGYFRFPDLVHHESGRDIDAVQHVADVVQHAGGDLRLAGLARGGDQSAIKGFAFRLRMLALGDVAKADHGADQPTVLANGRTYIFHRKTGPILPPKHLVIDVMHRPVAERGVNGTFLSRVRGAVRFCVVQNGVLRLADQFLRFPADHLGGGWVYKRGPALQIQPIDPFPRGVKDLLVVAPDALSLFFHPFTLGNLCHERSLRLLAFGVLLLDKLIGAPDGQEQYCIKQGEN